MTRSWYVAPYRVLPILPVPGQMRGCDDYWTGPDPAAMAVFRGPVPTCRDAVVLADAWRAEGRRSDLWLVLVEDGYATHTMKFDKNTIVRRRGPFDFTDKTMPGDHKTTLGLQAAVAHLQRGGTVAYIDSEASLDPEVLKMLGLTK